MSESDEITTISTASQQDFIDEMKIAVYRSSTKAVFGYRNQAEAQEALERTPEGSKLDRSVIMVIETLGMLAIDDLYHAPVTRENGTTSSPLYELEQPHRWPSDLWGRLRTYTWMIDHAVNPLDTIARRV